MTPRVSLLVCISSEGDQYIALSQSNSNESMMSLFWKSLVLKLDKEKPGWRKTSIWTLDGAAYHYSEASLNLLEQLRIPLCMQGPHR